MDPRLKGPPRLRKAPFLYLCGVSRARVAALALIAGLAAACSGPPVPLRPGSAPPPQTLRLALGGTPSSLDPALQRDPWERALASFYLEPLLRPRPDLADVAPGAAASYDVSPDGRLYTFHLDPAGRFSDGAPVTAADFVFSWRRLLDPRVASPHADLFAGVVAGGAYAEALDPEDPAAPIDQALGRLGLAAPDPATFQVRLARPAPWFKWLATVWAGAPVEAAAVGRRGAAWTAEPAAMPVNGPFEIASTAGGVVSLVPNPRYRTRPGLRLVQCYEDAPGAAFQRFQAGQLDEAPVPAGETGVVTSDRTLSAELHRVPQLTTAWLAINTFSPPLGSPGVRRALAAAFDRAAYLAGPLAGRALPADQLLPLGQPGRLEGPAGLQSDPPSAAGRLLAAAGVRPAALAHLHVLVEATPEGRALGGMVRAGLRAAFGVNAAVEAVPAKEYADRLLQRQFDLAGPVRWSADYPDPQDWLDQFLTSNGANAGRFQDPLYDELVGLGDTALDPGSRARAYEQAQLRLGAQVPAVFLDQPVAWVLVSNRVAGLTISPFDPAPVLGTARPEDLLIGG